MDTFLAAIPVSPEPLSPLFQPGGRFEGWNEDLTEIGIFLVMLAILDVAVATPLINPKGRWFFLHTAANIVATFAAWPDVVRGLTDPVMSWTGRSHTMFANSAISAIHVYHCLAFPLTKADIFHHVAFVSILCGLGIYFKQIGGIANNFGCFFLSGLPGGLDYIMLVLKAEGKLEKMTEKKWNAVIQQWIRGPSMSIYLFIAFTAWYNGQTAHMHVCCVVLVAGLHFYNGIHYADEAVGSYYTWKERLSSERSKKAK